MAIGVQTKGTGVEKHEAASKRVKGGGVRLLWGRPLVRAHGAPRRPQRLL
jgi:hypothetical protein